MICSRANTILQDAMLVGWSVRCLIGWYIGWMVRPLVGSLVQLLICQGPHTFILEILSSSYFGANWEWNHHIKRYFGISEAFRWISPILYFAVIELKLEIHKSQFHDYADNGVIRCKNTFYLPRIFLHSLFWGPTFTPGILKLFTLTRPVILI